MEYVLLIIGATITVILSLIGYLATRAISGNDKSIAAIEIRLNSVETKSHAQDIRHEKMSGQIDLVLELLERIETKIVRKS